MCFSLATNVQIKCLSQLAPLSTGSADGKDWQGSNDRNWSEDNHRQHLMVLQQICRSGASRSHSPDSPTFWLDGYSHHAPLSPFEGGR